ncbi:hypothetical protein PIB30_055102 [Stylosanthes scabra]|uniref:Uncharacterized protein n=1 Tax=Stylosanthes scabra TaxID=79078 RepID=A0ABU6TJK9_9FABA|nr:hypothetical protein [Stylosanthes scabra]
MTAVRHHYSRTLATIQISSRTPSNSLWSTSTAISARRTSTRFTDVRNFLTHSLRPPLQRLSLAFLRRCRSLRRYITTTSSAAASLLRTIEPVHLPPSNPPPLLLLRASMGRARSRSPPPLLVAVIGEIFFFVQWWCWLSSDKVVVVVVRCDCSSGDSCFCCGDDGGFAVGNGSGSG